jgi:Flp pilus assembly protein TadG
MSRRRRRAVRSDERGAILVIWTVALVALFVLAALSVDVGNEAQVKQHVVTAAEDAALSAVSDLSQAYSGSASATPPAAAVTAAEALAVQQAESYAYLNYAQANLNPASPTNAWNDCGSAVKDAAAGGPYSVTPYSTADCIGFFSSPPSNPVPNGIVVAIPSQTVQFGFGIVGGVKSAQVSSVAAASLGTPVANFLLPFGLNYATGDGVQCLQFSSGGGTAPPCPGFANGSGSFGLINSPRYLLFPGESTNQGITNIPLQEDLVLGLDHPLQVYPETGPEICDWNPALKTFPSDCPYNPQSYNAQAPYADGNAAIVDTGQTAGVVGAGLFTGISASDFSGAGVTDPCGTGTMPPRFAHPLGFEPTSTSSCSPGTPVPSPSLNPGVTPTGSSTTETFGYPSALDGVHVTDYLDTADQQLFSYCYGSLSPEPQRNVDEIDTNLNLNQKSPSYGDSIWEPNFSQAPEPSPVAGTGDACLSSAMANLAAGTEPSTPSVTLPLFSKSIVSDPRFGLVPVLGTESATGSVTNCAGGSTPCEILGFQAVFLYTAFPKGGTGTVGALEAWVFPPSFIAAFSVPGPRATGYSGGPYAEDLCSLTTGNC